MEAVLYLIIPLFILLFLGVPVAFAFFIVLGINAIAYFGFTTGPYLVITSLYNSLAMFNLLPVPLFIAMGIALFESGLAMRAVDSLSRLFGGIPGRLSYLSCVAGALLGLLSGATVASVAIMGSTILPEMLKRGYSKDLTFGPILASAGLAMIIPPSSLTVIYATVAELPVGKLLIAGVIPGILMALCYMVLIFIKIKRNPSSAPVYDAPKTTLKEKIILTVKDILPLCIIVFLVTGSFMIGICTPTESAALGAVGTIILAAIYKRLNGKIFVKILTDTIKISGMTLLIIGSTVVYSYLLAYTGLIANAVNLILAFNLPDMGVLCVMIIIVLILGCIIESVPIMMITLPIFCPIAKAVGFNGIWLGIIILIVIQIGLTTPPFGMLLFVLKGTAPKDTKMAELYVAVAPYIVCNLVIIALIIIIPSLALWLPEFL